MKLVQLVDDEPHVIRVLKLCLEREGYRVRTAATGFEALTQIRQERPDALVTDISMPGMDGRSLCRTVRTAMPDASFPIFVMTSMTGREERDWVRELGGITFLEKPVSPRRLIAQLAERLAPAQAAEDA